MLHDEYLLHQIGLGHERAVIGTSHRATPGDTAPR
jgi:hypothetical protein